MTQASAALRRSGRVRTKRQATKAIEAAGHAADLLAWRQERAERIRAAEQARQERIAEREAAIEDATVAYLLAAQAKEKIMAEALARCAEHDKAAATAVAGLREAGLTRADIAQVTGASSREVAGLLGSAHTGDDADTPDEHDGTGVENLDGADDEQAGVKPRRGESEMLGAGDAGRAVGPGADAVSAATGPQSTGAARPVAAGS